MAGNAKKKRARAYCSSANLGPGFDVFGIALDAFYDEVSVAIPDKNTGSGKITITDIKRGSGGNGGARPLPADPDANTAGLVARDMLGRHGITDDIVISISKGVPTGLGLGSSAASAAASAIACDRLYGLNQTKTELVMAAGRGEKASAGTIHYDNVAASVVGGFAMVRPGNPIAVAGHKVSPALRFCVAIPTIDTPDKKTKVSRGVLPKKITLKDGTYNLANASFLAVSLATKNNEMLGRGITADVIAEPARKHMIPGFDHVRKAALDAGAKEVMISGAGPSVVAITDGSGNRKVAATARTLHKKVADAMSAGFEAVGIRCRTVICKPAGGARIIR